MDFDVYCDESCPELLSSKNPGGTYMVIGSVWLESIHREKFKADIHDLRDKHRVGGEFKWQKVSPSRQSFYQELVEWFFDRGDTLRYRCIAIDRTKADLVRFHASDAELAFYKFYYQMLHHWILDFNSYSVFCDIKPNRHRDRLKVLDDCLDQANLSSTVKTVQAIRSDESVLLQLADVFTGAVSSRMNGFVRHGSAKASIVEAIESRLRRRIAHTFKGEQKFNVFQINLGGGW